MSALLFNTDSFFQLLSWENLLPILPQLFPQLREDTKSTFLREQPLIAIHKHPIKEGCYVLFSLHRENPSSPTLRHLKLYCREKKWNLLSYTPKYFLDVSNNSAAGSREAPSSSWYLERAEFAADLESPALHASNMRALLVQSFRYHAFFEKEKEVESLLHLMALKDPSLSYQGLSQMAALYFASSHPNFAKRHTPEQMSACLKEMWLLRQKIEKLQREAARQQEFFVSLLDGDLHFQFCQKGILVILLGLSFLAKEEVFKGKHLLAAIRSLLPEALPIQASFHRFVRSYEAGPLFYIELHKEGGLPFSEEEKERLGKALPAACLERIERRFLTLFAPRNEGEIMKNLSVLGGELLDSSSLSQICLQSPSIQGSSLLISVLLARVVKKGDPNLDTIFSKQNLVYSSMGKKASIVYLPEMSQRIDSFESEYTKELSVFNLEIQGIDIFQRKDFSLDLGDLRVFLMSYLQDCLGSLQDYGGAFIGKRRTQLSRLLKAFSRSRENSLYADVLESFFYALSPTETQLSFLAENIFSAFQSLLRLIKAQKKGRESESVSLMSSAELSTGLCISLRFPGALSERTLKKELHARNIDPLAFAESKWKSFRYVSYFYEFQDLQKKDEEKEMLQRGVQEAVEACVARVSPEKSLRLHSTQHPLSLDPRLGGAVSVNSIIRALFDGLTRLDKEGSPFLSLAVSHEMSKDGLRHTFVLKESFWSNGDRLISEDFAYTWRKILLPSFQMPFSYLFYVIRNAYAIKGGQLAPEELAVHCPDEKTLVIDLEHPCSYFLDLVAHCIFYPVNHRIDSLYPDWTFQSGKDYVCNGPFVLHKNQKNKFLELRKNLLYHEAKSVQLENILIDTGTEIKEVARRFKKGDFDWFGGPWGHRCGEFFEKKIQRERSLMRYWSLNVTRYPFDDIRVRQAFAYALDRHAIVDEMGRDLSPASSLFTSSFSPESAEISDPRLLRGDQELARKLFKDFLKEKGLRKLDFAPIEILCADTASRSTRKLLSIIKRSLKKVLGISCHIVIVARSDLYERIYKQEYQSLTIEWENWVKHPMYLFAAFQKNKDFLSFFYWDDPEYCEAFEKASLALDPQEEKKHLQELERILLEKYPLIPLYTRSNEFVKSPHLNCENTQISAGSLDLKEIFLSSTASSLHTKWIEAL